MTQALPPYRAKEERAGACPRQRGGRYCPGISREEYLLADQPSELERLQLQSRVWEPSGRRLLTKVGDGSGLRALDVGCGALGWLRVLSEWVGPSGHVVGFDIEETLLDAARSFLDAERISNVCERCGRIATDVHHRVDLRDGGDPYASENLASLCHECHAKVGRERQVAVGEEN